MSAQLHMYNVREKNENYKKKELNDFITQTQCHDQKQWKCLHGLPRWLSLASAP